MNNFTDIKIGDRVWDFTNGWGVVRLIEDRTFQVDFGSLVNSNYFFNGKNFLGTPSRTLFWDSVEIVPPPKPEHKEEKINSEKVYCKSCRYFSPVSSNKPDGCEHGSNLIQKSTALSSYFKPKTSMYILNKNNDCGNHRRRGWGA